MPSLQQYLVQAKHVHTSLGLWAANDPGTRRDFFELSEVVLRSLTSVNLDKNFWVAKYQGNLFHGDRKCSRMLSFI